MSPPWMEFWACIVVCSACATIFITPLYAPSLEAWVGLSYQSFQLWAAILDGAALFAMPASFCLSKFGLRACGAMAGCFDLAGYSLLSLVASHRLTSPSLLYVAAILMGQGSIFSVMLTLQYAGSVFAAKDRGKILGVLMTAFGLSGGIFTACFKFFWRGVMTTNAFFFCGLLMFFIKMTAVSILSDPARDHRRREPITASDACLTENLGFLVIIVFLVSLLPFASPRKVYAVAAAVTIPYLLSVVGLFLSAMATAILSDECFIPYDDYLNYTAEEATPIVHKKVVKAVPPAGTPFLTAIKQLRFWVLWYQLAILVGGGFAFLNHLHDIIASESTRQADVLSDVQAVPHLHSHALENYGTSDQQKIHLVIGATSFFTVGNVCSRFLTGYGADILSKVISRSTLMNISMVLLLGSFILLMLVDVGTDAIFFPAVVNGWAFGTPWTLVPAIEQGWFGMDDFAAIHSVMMLACVFGAFIINDFLSVLIMSVYSESSPVPVQNMTEPEFEVLWMCLGAMTAIGLIVGCLIDSGTSDHDPTCKGNKS
eukprot:gb/GEZN01004568.1/.p1 GENE.gb/GEZN01004568.1/~~gb/GEZN01004568.1/.p1  ORF type:complete len:542 (+),score=48.73 gb/GEZN01004568.1/:180-1805(+)